MVQLYLKAFHIVFVVTWFAGLFYIVRLFIYQTEALEKPEAEKVILYPLLSLMSRRLWMIITWPSAIITLILGSITLWKSAWHLEFSYMWVKLGLVFLLYIYHAYCHVIYKRLQNGIKTWSSQQLRLWNEIATVLLIAIVVLITVRTAMSWIWALAGLFTLMALLMILTRLYKNYRQRNGEI